MTLQGSAGQKRRLERIFKASKAFYDKDREHILQALSLNLNTTEPAVLFDYENVGPIELFLNSASPLLQYVAGKKTGIILRTLHHGELSEHGKMRIKNLEVKNLKRLEAYLNGPYRFEDDKATILSLTSRFKSFGCKNGVLRLGALSLENILLNSGHVIKILPPPSYAAGDRAEDLALLCADASLNFPHFCSGVMDGYGVKDPKLWLRFAMYCALISLDHYGKMAGKYGLNTLAGQEAVLKSRQVRDDFEDFKTPVPRWYKESLKMGLKEQSLKAGL